MQTLGLQDPPLDVLELEEEKEARTHLQTEEHTHSRKQTHLTRQTTPPHGLPIHNWEEVNPCTLDLRLKISDVQIHTRDMWQGLSGMCRFCC